MRKYTSKHQSGGHSPHVWSSKMFIHTQVRRGQLPKSNKHWTKRKIGLVLTADRGGTHGLIS